MKEIFQKTAKSERLSELRRTGVLSAASFDDYSNIRAFLPADNLQSLVSHYWIVRWDVPDGITYRPTEVLSEPAVNIFVNSHEAFLYGLTTQTFDYEAKARGVLAGVTFRPGGFYPYWGEDMVTLPPGKSNLQGIFPSATPAWSKRVCGLKDDQVIAEELEAMLNQKVVTQSLYLKLIHSIMQSVNFDQKFRSIQEVARHFHISERSLQLLFRREVGTSLKWVIMRARLLEAVGEAYGKPEPDWVQIATDLGYTSQSHFIDDFKRATGFSPANFYKQARN